MNTILNYLNGMFQNFPSTSNILKAKEQIQHAMEQRYYELIADNKKEHEAIGIVISEYGNLTKTANRLNIANLITINQDSTANQKTDNEPANSAAQILSLTFVQSFVKNCRTAASLLALGIAFCILSPTILIISSFSGNFSAPFIIKNNIVHLSSANIYTHMGILSLLIMISLAIFLFIIASCRKEKYDYLKTTSFSLEQSANQYIQKLAENTYEKATIKTITGIVLCIIGALPILVITLLVNNEICVIIGTQILLFFIAIASYLFITANTIQECSKYLLNEGCPSANTLKVKHLIRQIGSIYWPLVIILYILFNISKHTWLKSSFLLFIACIIFGIISNVISYSFNNPCQK